MGAFGCRVSRINLSGSRLCLLEKLDNELLEKVTHARAS
jgi:hypothetical protein